MPNKASHADPHRAVHLERLTKLSGSDNERRSIHILVNTILLSEDTHCSTLAVFLVFLSYAMGICNAHGVNTSLSHSVLGPDTTFE